MIKAFRGASGSPAGAGMRSTMPVNRPSRPAPVLALTFKASWASMPMISSISRATRAGSAEGRSILFSTGTTSRPLSMAEKQLATV